ASRSSGRSRPSGPWVACWWSPYAARSASSRCASFCVVGRAVCRRRACDLRQATPEWSAITVAPMPVVVTGASGHLGANLVRTLLDRGEQVRVLVHRSSAALADIEARLERVEGSVCEPESLGPAFAGADRVYHLAGVISIDGDPDGRVHRVNVE